MQGFEMFLYGTNNPLYDYKTNKWEMAGAGFQAVLNIYKQLYAEGLAPSPQAALNPNMVNGARATAAPGQAGHRPRRQLGPSRHWLQGRHRTVAAVEQGPWAWRPCPPRTGKARVT